MCCLICPYIFLWKSFGLTFSSCCPSSSLSLHTQLVAMTAVATMEEIDDWLSHASYILAKYINQSLAQQQQAEPYMVSQVSCSRQRLWLWEYVFSIQRCTALLFDAVHSGSHRQENVNTTRYVIICFSCFSPWAEVAITIDAV